MSFKKLIAVAVVLIVGISWFFHQPDDPVAPPVRTQVQAEPAQFAGAPGDYSDRDSGRMISAQGTVTRVLSDDREGSPHQRFIIRVADGQTLLVAHNLDLAERLDGLREGDSVSVHGQYEWNDKGGVIHWTHDDPDGQHAAGYIDWNGRRYQ